MLKLLDRAEDLFAFAETEPYWAAAVAADGFAFLPNPELMNIWVEKEGEKPVAALKCDTESLVLLTKDAPPSAEMLFFIGKLLEDGLVRRIHTNPVAAAVLKNLFPLREEKRVLMACSSALEPSFPEGLTLRENASIDELFDLFVAVLGDEDHPEKEFLELKLRRGMAHGQTTVFTLYDGEKAVSTAMIRGRTENSGAIASVMTREDYRKRGCASYLTALCAGRLLEEGKTPWLIPAEETAQKLYEKLGFTARSTYYNLFVERETTK